MNDRDQADPHGYQTPDEARLVDLFSMLSALKAEGITPYRAMIGVRDGLIRRGAAAAGIDGRRPWRRAEIVAEAARTFLARRWPSWRNYPEPPPSADALDAAFWRCCRMGCELPESPSQYWNLFSPTDDADIEETCG